MILRPWIPLALAAALAAEVVVFIVVGELVGFPLTLLAIALASILGVVMVRREGLRTWRAFRTAALAGQRPGQQLTDGLVGLGGALLLATPGLVSTVAGAALLTPPLRAVARAQIQARAERRMSAAQATDMFGPRRVRVRYDQPQPDAPVVEGEIIDPATRPGGDPQ